MKIIIAPNSFKGSLNAFKVAQAIREGLQKSLLEVECELFPIADGGDHTLEVFQNWLGGTVLLCNVIGPMGQPISADWVYMNDGKTAVIEMAKASGLSHIDKSALNPLKANSFGTGQLIRAALDEGAEKIILGLGGSATVDGGLGILQALGAELITNDGSIIANSTNPLTELVDVRIDNLDPRVSNVEFLILCDVENPLLGVNGAAHIFGPQKGAGPQEVELLEKYMNQFNRIIITKTGNDYSNMPGAGAAGGIAVSLKAFFNAKIVNGVEFLLEKMNFEKSIQTAGLLITAEGKVDRQTLHGKGPLGVAQKAKNYGIPSVILAGRADDIDQLNDEFTAVLPITNGPMSLEEAMNRTYTNLVDTAKQIGNLLVIQK